MSRKALIVSSLQEAKDLKFRFIGKKVLLIRIFSVEEMSINRPPILLQSFPSFHKCKELFFDDTENVNKKGTPFSEADAKEVSDFVEENLDQIDIIYIHCNMGISRSPAIAMALNVIYDLGYDDVELSRRFPHYNRIVHNTMLRYHNINTLEGLEKTFTTQE